MSNKKSLPSITSKQFLKLTKKDFENDAIISEVFDSIKYYESRPPSAVETQAAYQSGYEDGKNEAGVARLSEKKILNIIRRWDNAKGSMGFPTSTPYQHETLARAIHEAMVKKKEKELSERDCLCYNLIFNNACPVHGNIK